MSLPTSRRADPASASAETPPPPAESTDLERRVLAHERVLQALIAYMARTEPHFVDHLIARFVEPMNTSRREQDHRDSDDYAEEFIHAVIRIGEDRVPEEPEAEASAPQSELPGSSRSPGAGIGQPAIRDRVLVAERNGIWEVKVDGTFRGDYHRKENALAAAALLKLSLR